jgi:hypothetical protein
MVRCLKTNRATKAKILTIKDLEPQSALPFRPDELKTQLAQRILVQATAGGVGDGETLKQQA